MDKKQILYILLAIFGMLGVFGIFSKRFDFTQEKRYTLSPSTLKVLESVEKPLTVDVYLEGDFPASFRQLQNETRFMLEEFRKVNPKIDFKFIDPIQTKMSKETLAALGMQPSVLPDMKDGKISEIVMFPYAILKYNSNSSFLILLNTFGSPYI